MKNLPENIRITKYKCFNSIIGFSTIKPVNVIIGRNNIGKTSVTEVFDYLVANSYPSTTQIIFDIKLDEEMLRKAFSESTSGGDIDGNHWHHGGNILVGKTISIMISGLWKPVLLKNNDENVNKILNTNSGRNLLGQLKNVFVEYRIRRLSAERDIVPEMADLNSTVLKPNGSGATNLVQNIINKEELDAKIVQDKLLAAFNEIIYPDIHINNIVTQIKPSGEWEIYIDDDINGRVALSKCGSGLKTVFLVLLNFITFPIIENNITDNRIYIMDELENNLHPALQRRLFSFIYQYAIENDCIIFLTTHSNVVIDLFSGKEKCSLYSMFRQDGNIKMQEMITLSQKKTILEELDIRASDLLQTNAIIWVEGPSDRIYINKIIQLSNKNLKEGIHYQFLYYGGRLLSHYSASEKGIDDLISILFINKNSIIVIDSDKTSKQKQINDTKKRIQDEFVKQDLLCWITKGREIENYIPMSVLRKYYQNEQLPILEIYEDIGKYLEKIQEGLGVKFENKKVNFAEEIVQYFEYEDIENYMDLHERIGSIVLLIKKWNKID